MGPILCAMDESDGAARAVRVAGQLSDHLKLRLVVIHLVEHVR
jgi:hypothetical protein